MNARIWTAFLVGFLCVSIVVFAFLARRPLCIDSKLVERFDRVGAESTVTMYRCSLRKHVPYDEKFSRQSLALSERLQNMERFFEWIGPLKNRINITIFESRPEVYKVYGKEVYLSEAVLDSPLQLEKSLLKVWFRERAHSSLADQPLIEESMTDFLVYLMQGKLELKDPITGVALDSAYQAKWPRVLQTTQGYCQSPWRLTGHLQMCASLEQMSKSELRAVNPHSVRALLTQSLISAYDMLPSKDKLTMSHKFGKLLGSLEFQGLFFGMSTLDFDKQGATQVSAFLQNWVKTLKENKTRSTLLSQWGYLVENEFGNRGFLANERSAYFDTLVWDESESDKIQMDLKSQMSSLQSKVIGYIKSQTIWILPNEEGLDISVLGPVKAQRGLVARCGLPQTKELLQFYPQVQRLLWVDACDRGQQLNVLSYLRGGAESFARNNREISFIEFHLPSLKMATEKSPTLELAHNLLGNFESSPQMSAGLGWQKPIYVKSVEAYRAQSAVEAIDWFRIKAPSRGL